uniref:Uncharacterized protein n=1 Tax=Glossina austeni TaxID=7395 RepID=A0A1A9UUQ6_GLOAU
MLSMSKNVQQQVATKLKFMFMTRNWPDKLINIAIQMKKKKQISTITNRTGHVSRSLCHLFTAIIPTYQTNTHIDIMARIFKKNTASSRFTYRSICHLIVGFFSNNKHIANLLRVFFFFSNEFYSKSLHKHISNN